MKSLSSHFSLAVLLGAMAVSAHAQEFKAGFVNTDRIFREASTAKAAQSKLEQEFSKREKELVDQGNTLKSASEKFEREAPTMAESQRVSRQRQLVDQDREFQRKRREFQEDLNSRKNEELAQVLERANKVVKQVAESEKYDVILQEAVYINPKYDITEQSDQGAERRRQVSQRPGLHAVSVLLGQILDALGGELVGGEREMPISRIAPLDSAGAGDLSFLSNPRYRQQLAASEAACVIVAPAMRELAQQRGACIVVPDPYAYFARATQWWKRNCRSVAAGRYPSKRGGARECHR